MPNLLSIYPWPNEPVEVDEPLIKVSVILNLSVLLVLNVIISSLSKNISVSPLLDLRYKSPLYDRNVVPT